MAPAPIIGHIIGSGSAIYLAVNSAGILTASTSAATFEDLPPSANLISTTAQPLSFGSPSYIGDAFTGDLSKVAFSTGKSISGSTTLEQPPSGYKIRPENSIRFDYISNSSGFNNSVGGNDGRTGVAANYVKADSLGQGDTFCYFASGFVTGTRAGAAHFLANPAVVLFAGHANAGSDHVYLNPVEILIDDNGFDAAGINFVANQKRSNDTGALGCVWFGFRSQSQGSVPVDAHFSAAGKTKIGLDLTGIITNQSGSYTKAAIILNAMDRIYFNGSPGIQPGYAVSSGLDGSYLWVEAGALKYKGASGTVTTLGAA